jgi:hypothetical protein
MVHAIPSDVVIELTVFLYVTVLGSWLQVCIHLLISFISREAYSTAKLYFNTDIQNLAYRGHILVLAAMLCAVAVVGEDTST